MRITGGDIRGRRLAAPKSRVRPTQDRVRAALFSCLGDRVPGARVLDLFAGSGALGLEAFSRGAAFVCWVEAGRRTSAVLRRNVQTLCGGAPERTAVATRDVFRFLARGGVGEPFDLVLADPPYDRLGETPWAARLFPLLEDGRVLKKGGLFAIEYFADSPEAGPKQGWGLWKRKRYGHTGIAIFVRSG